MDFRSQLASLPGYENESEVTLCDSKINWSNSIVLVGILLTAFVILAFYRTRIIGSRILHTRVVPTDSLEIKNHSSEEKPDLIQLVISDRETPECGNSAVEVVHSGINVTEEENTNQLFQLVSNDDTFSVISMKDRGVYLADNFEMSNYDSDTTPVNSPGYEIKYNVSMRDIRRAGTCTDVALFPDVVTDIDLTLDELAIKMLPEEELHYAMKLPLGWQRTKRISELTSKLVDLGGFTDIKLTYKSMLGKLCIGYDSLTELAIPPNDHISSTKQAIKFLGAYGAQLNAMCQALIDVVNGVNDINRACGLIAEYGKSLETRITPSVERASYTKESTELHAKKYEALLRFHQLFLEYRFSGRARNRAIILGCFKERLLRSYSFLRPLNYVNGTDIEEIYTIGQEVLKYAHQFYNETQHILQTWSLIRPSVKKVGLFHHGLTEAQADLTTDCANRLIHLSRRVNNLQQGIVKRYYFSAESELIKLLLYYDKNRLCIRLSESIGFDALFRESCAVLNTIKNDQHVSEMLHWLQT